MSGTSKGGKLRWGQTWFSVFNRIHNRRAEDLTKTWQMNGGGTSAPLADELCQLEVRVVFTIGLRDCHDSQRRSWTSPPKLGPAPGWRTQPDEPYRQLSLWDNVGDAPQNIQRDDLVEASTEKSALGETQTLIEDVVDDTILEMAWARVKANRGAPGPDGITLAEFPEWFRPQWSTVRQQLIDGSYRPSPARRVTIDKPDGGTRELGIPVQRGLSIEFLAEQGLFNLEEYWESLHQ